MGGIPTWQSSSRWYRWACLLDEYGPPQEYGDDLKIVQGLEVVLQSLKLAHKGQDCWQAAAEAFWPLLSIVKMQLKLSWQPSRNLFM